MSLPTVRMMKVSTRRGPSAGASMAATNEATARAHVDSDREVAPRTGRRLREVGLPGRWRGGEPGLVRYLRALTGLGRSGWIGGQLDLEELGFLVLKQLVHLCLVGMGELVELALGPAHVILARVTVLDHLVQGVLAVPPDVPDRDAAVLGLVPRGLDVLATPLLGQL